MITKTWNKQKEPGAQPPLFVLGRGGEGKMSIQRRGLRDRGVPFLLRNFGKMEDTLWC